MSEIGLRTPGRVIDLLLPARENRALARALFASVFILQLYAMTAGHVLFFPLDPALAHREDFIAFHTAAVEAASGRLAAIYDPATFQARLPAWSDAEFLWLYPPSGALLLAPLAVLPYGLAKFVLFAASAAALAASGRTLGLSGRWTLLLLLSPALYVTFYMGQATALFAAAAAAGLAQSRSRPVAAALCFAALTAKPQLGLLVPVFLAARGDWRCFGWTAVFSIALAALSAAVFGFEAWRAFFAAVLETHVAHMDKPHPAMVAVGAYYSKWGAPDLVGDAAQTICFFAAVAIVWHTARRRDAETARATALVAVFLATPYAWHYDLVLAAPAIALVAARGERLKPWAQVALAGLWFAPIFLLDVRALQLAPVAPLLILAAVVGFAIDRRRMPRIVHAPMDV